MVDDYHSSPIISISVNVQDVVGCQGSSSRCNEKGHFLGRVSWLRDRHAAQRLAMPKVFWLVGWLAVLELQRLSSVGHNKAVAENTCYFGTTKR